MERVSEIAQSEVDCYIRQLEHQMAPPAAAVSVVSPWLVVITLLASFAFYACIVWLIARAL